MFLMRERKIKGVRKGREDECLFLELTAEATGHVGVTELSNAL
jgi:hypothetical protein